MGDRFYAEQRRLPGNRGLTIQLDPEQLRVVMRAFDKLSFDSIAASRKAQKLAMRPLKARMKSNIRGMTRIKDASARNEYAKSIGERSQTYRRNGVAINLVGARDKLWPTGRNWAKLQHLFEYGVQAHRIGRGSSMRRGLASYGAMHPGIEAEPHIRPAFDATKHLMLRLFTEHMRRFAEQGWPTGKRRAA